MKTITVFTVSLANVKLHTLSIFCRVSATTGVLNRIRPEFFFFLFNGNFFEKIESGGRNKKKKKASKVTSRVDKKNKIEKRAYFFFFNKILKEIKIHKVLK